MTRIVLADDHAIVRRGLRQIIADAPGLAVVGEAGSANELLTLLRSRPADLTVLDLGLGTHSGLELIKQIRNELPRMRILIVSMHPEALFAERALRAGASGYVQKDDDPEALLTAIQRVASGRMYLSPQMTERLASQAACGKQQGMPHERLSDREFEVLRLLGRGMSITAIARVMNLSVKTVSTHRTRIVDKTGLETNADMVAYVNAHGLQ
jgi:two-component system, NarL family, invasion response regulator UvrY